MMCELLKELIGGESLREARPADRVNPRDF
jgi:hypothetical protein